MCVRQEVKEIISTPFHSQWHVICSRRKGDSVPYNLRSVIGLCAVKHSHKTFSVSSLISLSSSTPAKFTFLFPLFRYEFYIYLAIFTQSYLLYANFIKYIFFLIGIILLLANDGMFVNSFYFAVINIWVFPIVNRSALSSGFQTDFLGNKYQNHLRSQVSVFRSWATVTESRISRNGIGELKFLTEICTKAWYLFYKYLFLNIPSIISHITHITFVWTILAIDPVMRKHISITIHGWG